MLWLAVCALCPLCPLCMHMGAVLCCGVDACLFHWCLILPSLIPFAPPRFPSQVLAQQRLNVVARLVWLSPSWGLTVSETLHLSEPSGGCVVQCL